jgi:hypothetical protein
LRKANNQVNKEIIMKTILKILAILLVALVVAGAMYALVSSTSTGAIGTNGQSPAFTAANGQTVQFPARPEGDFGGDHQNGASFGGLFGVFGTLAKLAVLITIVLLAEKGISTLKQRIPRANPV